MWMWRSFTGTIGHLDLRASYVTRPLARHERKPFVQLHDLCRREVLRPAGPDASYLEGCRILFAATLQRELLDRRDEDSGAPDVVASARSWMDAHLDSREPIGRLCDYLDVSQSTLYRAFAGAMAMSPLAVFHRSRMEKGRELLTTSHLSVKEIAHALGYEHANDLSRAYRRHFGEPPTRTRKQETGLRTQGRAEVGRT
jgi:AraC family transcriptional regulator of arabinose operon